MHTLRAIAPAGTINPDGNVRGTVTGFTETTVDGTTVRLAAFRPDFPVKNSPTSRRGEFGEFIEHAQPVYVPAEKLQPLTYEPSITVTHDGGFNSPEESAEAMLDWLRDEVTSEETDVHVHVACEDGFTYSVHVTKDDDGKINGTLEGVWKAGIK